MLLPTRYTRRARAACILLLLGTPARGWGQEAIAEPTAAVPPPEPASTGSEDKAELLWSGRLFVGDLLTRQRIAGETFWRNRQTVNSARLGLRYRRPEDSLKAVIKLEVEGGNAKLRDGYLSLGASEGLAVQAGRFKRQMSGIALASKWDLPSIERGLLGTLEVEGQELPFSGGRGDGLMLGYQAEARGKPAVSVSLFQNQLGYGAGSLDAKEHFAQDAYLRVSAEPVEGLQLASSLAFIGYLKTVGDSDSFKHAPVGSLELSYKAGWLRIWAEGFAGKSMFAKLDGTSSGRFWAARSLIALNLKPSVPTDSYTHLRAHETERLISYAVFC